MRAASCWSTTARWCAGTRLFLEGFEGIEVVGEATDGDAQAGQAVVCLRLLQRWVELTIEDDGVGIARRMARPPIPKVSLAAMGYVICANMWWG